MPSPANCLEIRGPDHELLDYASPERALLLIEAQLVDPVGTHKRIRALVARRGRETQLRASSIPTGTRFSHDHETTDNPRGVWTFHKKSLNPS